MKITRSPDTWRISIPPAALEAGVEAANELDPYYVNREQIRAAFEAMVAAWPGMRVDDTFRWLSEAAIILPMEDKNAEG